MVNERESRGQIRAALKAAGYRVVQLDSKLGDTKMRADAVGYAANADGDLVPWIVVEAKNGVHASPEIALPRLLQARELLGTVEHYAVLNGQWFHADRSLRSFDPVDGPVGPANDGQGWVTDPGLATSLLSDRLWYEADRRRGKGQADFFFPSAELFMETAPPGVETTQGDFVPVRPDVLWQARRRSVAGFMDRMRWAGEHSTTTEIADAVARLLGNRLGGTVLDPFCGIGNFLWAALERAAAMERPPEFIGQDINVELAELAGQIARTAPLLANVTAGDSFEGALPAADCVVAAPPFGVRTMRPWTLLDGTSARELETAALDVCIRQLRPGGRAVLLLPNGITFRQNLEPYRRYLANEFRIGALIGLPSGALVNTGVRAVLLVIDSAPPGEAFVAQLGEDWRSQLSETGAVMNAALEHLDGE